MLLAYYEVWCADHQKWSNHLLGAAMLLREIDFESMTKHIRAMKQQLRREEQEREYGQLGYDGTYGRTSGFSKSTEDVDDNIVAVLMGKQLKYDHEGRIVEEGLGGDERYREYTERDLDMYETQRDLWWWYCKQDAYQSILAGGKLLYVLILDAHLLLLTDTSMDYSRWSHCQPRAPLGRLNAT
jgi:hypothetical protein